MHELKSKHEIWSMKGHFPRKRKIYRTARADWIENFFKYASRLSLPLELSTLSRISRVGAVFSDGKVHYLPSLPSNPAHMTTNKCLVPSFDTKKIFNLGNIRYIGCQDRVQMKKYTRFRRKCHFFHCNLLYWIQPNFWFLCATPSKFLFLNIEGFVGEKP